MKMNEKRKMEGENYMTKEDGNRNVSKL